MCNCGGVNMAQKEPKDWITVNGKHIPIYEGESKQDAYNKAVAKMNEDKKAADIAKRKAEVDKLNGKKSDDDKFIDDLVADIIKDAGPDPALNPEHLMSNSDVQSVVEAYAIEHKGVDENKMLDKIHSKLNKWAIAEYEKRSSPTAPGKSELFKFNWKDLKGNQTAGDVIIKYLKENKIPMIQYYLQTYADVDKTGTYYAVNHEGNGLVTVNRKKKYKPD